MKPLPTHAIRRATSTAVKLILAICLSGCGSNDSRLETHPVSGSVFINGEPASGCTVTFVPRDAELRGAVIPAGSTDESGTFQLTTYETGDGAPAGEYGVSLIWEATSWPSMNAEGGIDPVVTVRPDRLLNRLSSPEKSGLKATVVEGENALEPFRLDNVKLLKGSK